MVRICSHCNARYEGDVARCPADGEPTYVASEVDENLGRCVGRRFTLVEVLGAGGMGTVYRAHQHSVDRDVAVKLLRRDRLSDENAIRRFFAEARATSRLTSPHSVAVFDFGQSAEGPAEDSPFYIAMELLRGRTLAMERVSHPGERIDPARAVRLVDQVLAALEEAHRLGILHRDLKPDNVFVLDQPPDFVKVLDFGLARIAGWEPTAHEANLLFGTPAYMSPEQAKGLPVDARSDLYSVGVMLFELVTGRLPLDDESPLVLMMKKVQGPSPRARVSAPEAGIPPALDDALARLLALDPAVRPADASAARALLRSAMAPAAPAPETPGVRTSVVGPLVRDTEVRARITGLHRVAAVLGGASRDAVRAMLAEVMPLAADSYMLYQQAAEGCRSEAGRAFFQALLDEAATVGALLRRASAAMERGESRWAAETGTFGEGDPAGDFDAALHESTTEVLADTALPGLLDRALAHERRWLDAWERHALAASDRGDRDFVAQRLREARDRASAVAEVKLRVVGMARGAGLQSLYVRLAGLLPVVRVRAGDALFREGEPGDSMVVVVRGRFRLSVSLTGGRDSEIGSLGPGDVVGEMACLDPAPRSATVTALSDAEVCSIDRQTLQELRQTDPVSWSAVMRAVLTQVVSRIRQADKDVAALCETFGVTARSVPVGTARVVAPALGLEPAESELLRQMGRSRALLPGGCACREGEPGNACYLVARGRLEVVKATPEGDRVLAVLEAGNAAGQMALVDGGPRSASLRAAGVVDLLELDRETFERMVAVGMPAALNLLERLAVTGIRQLRTADRWLALLVGVPLGERPGQRSRPTHPSDTMPLLDLRAALGEWGLWLDDPSASRPVAGA